MKMLKIKKTILSTLALFLLLSSFFFSCQENNDIEPQNELTKELKLFVNQFYDTSNLDIEVLKVENTLNTNSKYIKSKSESIESYNSFYMEIDTKTDEGIIKINSITFDSKIEAKGENSNAEYITSIVSLSNESGYENNYELVFEKINEQTYKIISTKVLSSEIAGKGQGWFSDYGDCIGRVLDTDGYAGKVITVLGIAGGAGCVPCGIAGAVIFGFGALGCAG